MTHKFWDKRARKYDQTFAQNDAETTRTVSELLDLLSERDQLLDFGCASGNFSLELAPYVSLIHGYDSSSKMIQLALKKARASRHSNIEFFNGATFTDAGINGQYSVIIALNVLHLVEDVSSTLERLHELLVPGGTLVAQTPCLKERSISVRSMISIAQLLGMAPAINHLGFRELESDFQKAGFTIVDSKLWERDTATSWTVSKKKLLSFENTSRQ